MGYSTDFCGEFKFNKPVAKDFKEYINRFSQCRHVIRDVKKLKEIDPDWKKSCYKGWLGSCGMYYCKDDGNFGQTEDESIIDINESGPCPSLWCQWIIETDVTGKDSLVWDGGEKFYSYIQWLSFLIKHFFIPEGYVLNGEVSWSGDDPDDMGIIKIEDNRIYVAEAEIIYNFKEVY